MRPILKRSSASSSPSYTPTHPPSHPSPSSHPPSHPHSSSSSHPHQPHHAVHFPPQPSLTRTFSAHSSSIYDRTPIAVTPNSCALPERGCPGRTYTLDESSSPSSGGGSGGNGGGGMARARRGHPSNGRDLHPRALAMGFHHHQNPHPSPEKQNITTNDTAPTARGGFPALPALIPDLSSASESDESDGFVSPPQYQDQAYYTSGSVTYRRVSLSPGVGGGEQYPPPLSFLPHPPSPPSHSHSHGRPRLVDDEDNVQIQRRRRDRRRSRSRSRSRSRDRVRTINTVAIQDEEDEYYDPLPLPSSPSPFPATYSSLSPSPSLYPSLSQTISPSPSIPKPPRKPRKSALCRTLPSLDIIMDDPVADVGCLGGF